MPTPIQNGELQLLRNVLVQAARDAMSDKPETAAEARAFLCETGAELAEFLGITTPQRVQRWAQSPSPKLPTLLTTKQIAAHAHVKLCAVYSAIRRGQLHVMPSLGDKTIWMALPSDVIEWEIRHVRA